MKLFGLTRPPRPAALSGGRLGRDRRAVVAIVLAFLALPLVVLVGIGIDYGISIRAQSLLNSAADSAAVAAANTAANAANQSGATSASIIAQGNAAGTQMFNAQIANIPNISTPVLTVNVTQPSALSATFAVTVSYTANYNTFFGRLIPMVANFGNGSGPGVPIFYLGGSASAQITLTAFEDFHIVMDTSGSMAIAATTGGMTSLAAATLIASNKAYQNISPQNGTYSGVNSYMGKGSQNCSSNGTYTCGAAQSTTQGCAFGCHWDNSNTHCTNCDFYEIAKANNISLRVNVEQQAVADSISSMVSQDSINQYRVAVYAFNNGLTTPPVSALPGIGATSAALTSAATAAAAMVQPVAGSDKSPAPPGALALPEPNTNVGSALTSLAAGLANCPSGTPTYIPCPGNGATQSTPQEFVFLITDGIEDFCTSASGASCNGRTIQPVQISECTALKNLGVQILVLYVQYVPLDVAPYYNSFYVNDGLASGGVQSFIDPGGNGVVPEPPPVGTVEYNLQQCASNLNDYIKVDITDDPNQIATALQTLLTTAENQGVRLTN